nr:bifunctional hydroxymethylpyrimidine kinase/phosphomethylpyrimidine kinase [Enterococcus sp. DIV1094]
MKVQKILTIGGSDPFAGGGIQSDLKTFENHHIFGMSALTCIGMLDSDGAFILETIPAEWLAKQLDSIKQMTDLDGIKIGLLHSIEAIDIVRDFLTHFEDLPIVIDPVFAFKETNDTLNQAYMQKMIQELFPLADVLTPNLKEAALLYSQPVNTFVQMVDCAKYLHSLGAKNVVIKGGTGIIGDEALDVLFNGKESITFRREKLEQQTVNGAGCTFASAITANLVLGYPLTEAVARSKAFVYDCILNGVMMKDQTGSVWSQGKGVE